MIELKKAVESGRKGQRQDNARRAYLKNTGLKRRNQWRMIYQQTQITGRTGNGQVIRLSVENDPIRRRDRKMEGF